MKTFFIIISIFFLFPDGQTFAQKFSLIELEKLNNKEIGEHDTSAIERINDDYFLIADDDSAELLVVNGKTGEMHKNRPKGKNFQFGYDWEAMTKDRDNFFYLIGSKQNFILRFKIDVCDNFKVIEESKLEINLKSLPQNVEIEGLAVRNLDGKKELIVGLRKKSESGHIQTFFAELTADNKLLEFTERFDFYAGKAEKITKKESYQFHLSSLEYIPELKGFLIMTSTENNSGIFFGSTLWFISDADIEKKKFKEKNYTPLRTEVLEPDKKAEGFCLIPNMEKIYKLAIVFDNDGKPGSGLYFYKLDGLP